MQYTTLLSLIEERAKLALENKKDAEMAEYLSAICGHSETISIFNQIETLSELLRGWHPLQAKRLREYFLKYFPKNLRYGVLFVGKDFSGDWVITKEVADIVKIVG